MTEQHQNKKEKSKTRKHITKNKKNKPIMNKTSRENKTNVELLNDIGKHVVSPNMILCRDIIWNNMMYNAEFQCIIWNDIMYNDMTQPTVPCRSDGS